ncbi:MAG: hypothetical protein JXR44_00445 [Thiotrichales bacterium]|nr:hypothetical protein [Thiotrichales bacterium]
MQVSIDISFYPLQEDYKAPITDFIRRLQGDPEIRVSQNSMSTSLHGDYAQLMALLEREIAQSLSVLPHSVFVLKLSAACH